MKRWIYVFSLLQAFFWITGCSTAYEAKPLSFRLPSAYNNAVNVGGAQIAAKAYANPDEAKRTFGFDVLGAGMLPVQVIFDNQGHYELEVIGHQSFLEDQAGNLWPILTTRIANERATKYAQTRKLFKEGCRRVFWVRLPALLWALPLASSLEAELVNPLERARQLARQPVL